MEYTEQMIYYRLRITALTFPNRKEITIPHSFTQDHQLSVNELRDVAVKNCQAKGMWFKGFELIEVEIEDRTMELETYNEQGVKVSPVSPQRALENLLTGFSKPLNLQSLALYNGRN